MRSIERRFNYQVSKNPNLSSFICFAKAVAGQRFSKDRLERMFNELVDKNDYEKDEKKGLLKYLHSLSRDPL